MDTRCPYPTRFRSQVVGWHAGERGALSHRFEQVDAVVGPAVVGDQRDVVDEPLARLANRHCAADDLAVVGGDADHRVVGADQVGEPGSVQLVGAGRSEEHTSELQSLMRISYAVFCLKQKKSNAESARTTQ